MKWLNNLLREEAAGEDGGGSGGGGGGGQGLLDGAGGESSGEVTEQPTKEAAETAYTPFSIYDEGKVSDKFLETLGEEDKGLSKFFSKYAGSEDPNKAMLQGIKNLQYLAGQKALEPLPEDAPDAVKEERRQLMAKLNGVPETPDGYGIKKPEDLPAGVYWPEEAAGKYAEVFHKHGASPELVQDILAVHNETLQGGAASIEQEIAATREAEMGKLKTEFGGEVDKVLNRAMRGAMTLGMNQEEAKAFATSSAAVKALAKVTELVSEDKLSAGTGTDQFGGNYREQALAIVNDPSNPLHKAYHDPMHPQHESAVKKRSELNAKWHAAKKTL